MDETLTEFVRDVRLKYLFSAENEALKSNNYALTDGTDDNFNRRLYIKSDWQPPEANDNIENIYRILVKIFINI